MKRAPVHSIWRQSGERFTHCAYEAQVPLGRARTRCPRCGAALRTGPAGGTGVPPVKAPQVGERVIVPGDDRVLRIYFVGPRVVCLKLVRHPAKGCILIAQIDHIRWDDVAGLWRYLPRAERRRSAK